ncbi:MAG: helix-turn-helix domain-containing protein [Butyricicoccus sp.]
MNRKAVGRRIQTARKERQLTQEQLADLADVSPTHISVVERGVKSPNLDTFVSIANALECSADELLIDVVQHSVKGMAGELSELLAEQPPQKQKRILQAMKVLLEDE